VIAVANTIIDECAVVVEPLDTLVAIVAMPGLLRPQIFALDAHIVKMKRFIQNFFKHRDKVVSLWYIARIDKCHNVKENRQHERDCAYTDKILLSCVYVRAKFQFLVK